MIDQPVSSDFAEAKQHFDREGYAIFRQVIDSDLLQEINSHLDWLQAKYPLVISRPPPGLLPKKFGLQLSICEVRLTPKLTSITLSLILSRVCIYHSRVNPSQNQARPWPENKPAI